MKFYRHLAPIKAISFDLDDTLYSNRPVMLSIEKKMVSYFAKRLPAYSMLFNRHYWLPFRQQVIGQQTNISHDVVLLRLESYYLGIKALGINNEMARQQAQAALDYFIALRSDFTVPQTSIQLLATLSKKMPLIAISNGNVDTQALNISHYFQHIYHAGFQKTNDETKLLLKQKPATDMFNLACQQLAISPSQLLHVGDCGYADIQGALRAGCQTAWLPHYGVGKPLKILPHIEISTITALELLIH